MCSKLDTPILNYQVGPHCWMILSWVVHCKSLESSFSGTLTVWCVAQRAAETTRVEAGSIARPARRGVSTWRCWKGREGREARGVSTARPGLRRNASRARGGVWPWHRHHVQMSVQRTVSNVSSDCRICSSREHHSTSSSMVTTPS